MHCVYTFICNMYGVCITRSFVLQIYMYISSAITSNLWKQTILKLKKYLHLFILLVLQLLHFTYDLHSISGCSAIVL